MTTKQFTAFVVAICVTLIALFYAGLVIALIVSTAEAIESSDAQNVSDEYGGLGLAAYGLYFVMNSFLLCLCYAGVIVHSGVGLALSCASIRAESRGVKIASIVMISLCGVMLATLVLIKIISLI